MIPMLYQVLPSRIARKCAKQSLGRLSAKTTMTCEPSLLHLTMTTGTSLAPCICRQALRVEGIVPNEGTSWPAWRPQCLRRFECIIVCLWLDCTVSRSLGVWLDVPSSPHDSPSQADDMLLLLLMMRRALWAEVANETHLRCMPA